MTEFSERRETNLDTLIAYHEAGHAVAAVALRQRLRSVTITPAEDSGGRVLTNAVLHSSYDIDSGSLWWARRNLVLLAAGPSAHAKYVGESTLTVLFEPACDDDRQLITDLLIDITRGEQPLRVVPEVEQAPPITEFMTSVEQTIAVADLLVVTYWSAVELLAAELIEKRTLTGKDVRRIVAPLLAK